MDFEYWYFVFVPVLFFAGWFCRGLDQRQRDDTTNLPEAYSHGLSLLLTGETDKAIDTFVEVVRIDPDLVDLHHVLGNLFRERGEFERAIRLHRHLYNRADLSKEERTRALKELAQDYIRAGFFDRAEAAFRRLSEMPSEHLYALRSLLEIYVTEHEWAAAIETARLLETQAGESHSAEIAHFYCERIDLALKRKNLEEATLLVGKALEREDATPRVGITAARVALAAGNGKEAVAHWERVAERFPEYLPIFVGPLADAMTAQGDEAGAVTLLRDACEKTRSIDAMEAALSRVRKLGDAGSAEAQKIVTGMLHARPSLLAFNALVQLKHEEDPSDEQTKMLASLLEKHARRLSRYQCRKCGFLASRFNWHCLGCGSWDSFPPRRIEDGKKA